MNEDFNLTRSKYIVFEGPGGAGKTTVMEAVAEDLQRRGVKVVATREPGGCPRAEKIRERLLGDASDLRKRTAWEDLELFYEARGYNMEEVVMPALRGEEAVVVLKDRDYMSTFMFQAVRGLTREALGWFHRQEYEGKGFSKPDLRLVLMVDRETARERRLAGGLGGDGYDELSGQFQSEVAACYGAEMLDVVEGRGLFARETRIVRADWGKEIVAAKALDEVYRCMGWEKREGEGTRGEETWEEMYYLTGKERLRI